MTRYCQASMRLVTLAAALVASSATAPSSKLQRVFQFETLGVRAAYLESVTGPAMHQVSGSGGVEFRDYRVDGCLVGAGIQNGDVRYLQLALTPRCNFNLGSFLGNGYGSTSGLTVGKFARGMFGAAGIRVQSGCIWLCGNAADPAVDFTWDGPHATNFVSVQLEVILRDTSSLDAVTKWSDAMKRREGQAYIEQTRFNCDRKWDQEGVRSFTGVPVSTVTIGFDLPSEAYAKRCG